MNEEWNDPLSDAEERALRATGVEREPSPDLEERIVSELKQRGLVRVREATIMRIARVVGAAAALAGVFAAGIAVGERRTPQEAAPEITASAEQQPAVPAPSQFMLLMYMRHTPAETETAPRETSKEAYRAIVTEYRDWAIAQQEAGRLVSAEKLSGAASVMVATKSEVSISHEPGGGGERVLGGYFLITARDMAEAVEISRTHPHLKYGGEVEIRPIEKTS